MKTYLITDTHFGHNMLINNKHREIGYEEKILKNLSKVKGDVLIHLGDFCIGNDAKWHEDFMKIAKVNFKKVILVRGNHDNKSYSWYYEHGWDFVCEVMRLRVKQKEIILSHMPILPENIDNTPYVRVYKNIHGHLHGKGNYSHRRVEGYDYEFNYDCAVDTHDYKPVMLDNLI